MVPLELLFQVPAIRVLSSKRGLFLSSRTVLPQENWKGEEERRGEGRQKKRIPVLYKNNWDLVESGIGY